MTVRAGRRVGACLEVRVVRARDGPARPGVVGRHRDIFAVVAVVAVDRERRAPHGRQQLGCRAVAVGGGAGVVGLVCRGGTVTVGDRGGEGDAAVAVGVVTGLQHPLPWRLLRNRPL